MKYFGCGTDLRIVSAGLNGMPKANSKAVILSEAKNPCSGISKATAEILRRLRLLRMTPLDSFYSRLEIKTASSARIAE